jgi:hypothetical protein
MRRQFLTIAILASVALQARADLISPDSQSLSSWADGSKFFFPKFDPSLGTLTTVFFSESARIGPLITYTIDPQHPPANPSVGFGGVASLLGDGPAFHSLYLERTFGGFMQAPGMANGSVLISGKTQWTSGLDSFIGNGLWSISFTGDYGFLFEDRPSGVGIGATGIQSDLLASVGYEYTPVPEPAAYGAVIGLALAGMWWRVKRRPA